MNNNGESPFGSHSQHIPTLQQSHPEPVLVLFNGAYIIPGATSDKPQWQQGAQIAARRAMSKRNSRSYAARVSRTKSRKKEILRRPAKPTLDTSFTKHRGSMPRQVYPESDDTDGSASVRKHTWLGLGRSGTRGKGLGIMKGTPQPEYHSDSQDPKTADTLTPGSRTWMDISPSDRPIPIGISIPSDSLPDYSPYQSTRKRSESDATLVTPSIIVTPAVAMKSVWSPDTESEYTPSIYSRLTMNTYAADLNAPPVPALPAGIMASSNIFVGTDHSQSSDIGFQTHTRHGTLDSAGTAFEDEEDFDSRRRDRITSTGTVFEEDEMPLRQRPHPRTALTVDTTTVPTPRSPRGWWNVITTPFEFSRRNSVWTQNGQNSARTPDIPVMPAQFDRFPDSPSTYMWSATDKSPSDHGGSPMIPIALSTGITDTLTASVKNNIVFQEASRTQKVEVPATGATFKSQSAQRFSAASSVSPAVSTAAVGAGFIPHQLPEHQQPIIANIELQDRPRESDSRTFNANPPLFKQAAHPAPLAPGPSLSQSTTIVNHPTTIVSQQHSPSPAPQEININFTSARGHISQSPQVQFPPPPHFSQTASSSEYRHYNRASSLVSEPDLKARKPQKRHRKVFNIMDWLPFSSGLKDKNKNRNDEKKKKSSRRRKWCWGCCCCLLILILLAIILPVVVILSRKHNSGTTNGIGGANTTAPPLTTPPSPSPSPSQWMNLTGYPPMPTGFATIAQPEAVEEQSGCVQPNTLWSCAVPKEDQEALKPNKPDQPNFKIEILFQNGTIADPSKTPPAKRALNPVSAGAFIRSKILGIRATPSASPAPPTLQDYKLLGETTDRNLSPFEGEETPFFINVLDSTATASSRLIKRANNAAPGSSTSLFPPPSTNADGTAAPANLLPNASGQPLRLFNRGENDEHYGFFVYYDRSIFIKDISRNITFSGNPSDINGGSPFDAASLRCTWAQTRFLVQIWTRSASTKPLLGSSATSASKPELKRPGTFPYPVTITIDRHGGIATSKFGYCYAMDKNGRIAANAQRSSIVEDRGFGGNLVNPANINLNQTGPVDGGNGGCQCQWQNWSA
jgi:hypothetical protein